VHEIFRQLTDGIVNAPWYEIVAVIFGIASVWYSRKENILVYPIGLINTLMYIHISVRGHLFGEASVNLYYSIMSVYGWIRWAKKDNQNRPELRITWATKKQWLEHLAFFTIFYVVIYVSLSYLRIQIGTGVLPAADAFASATAFTGMWLMTKKKVESWYWWLATNIASVPLYFVKGYVFTSFYYVVLFVLAIFGLISWMKKASQHA
jgi:nicotinamide mononucleotide transporter